MAVIDALCEDSIKSPYIWCRWREGSVIQIHSVLLQGLSCRHLYSCGLFSHADGVQK